MKSAAGNGVSKDLNPQPPKPQSGALTVSEGGLTAPASGQGAGGGEVPPNIQDMLDGFMKGQ